MASSVSERLSSGTTPGDPTARHALRRADYIERIRLIERIADETDELLCDYILKAVTEGLSYTHLRTKMGMPCGRDMYYDRYRRFFWLLDNARD